MLGSQKSLLGRAELEEEKTAIYWDVSFAGIELFMIPEYLAMDPYPLYLTLSISQAKCNVLKSTALEDIALLAGCKMFG